MTDTVKPNPYRAFKTDKDLEAKGVYVDYGTFRVLCGRAGGNNKRYLKVLEKNVKPHRRAIQTETMEDAQAEQLLLDSFVDGVILGWEVQTAPPIDEKPAEWASGMHDIETGEVVSYSRARVLSTLRALPDLFSDLREQTSKTAMFLQDVRENDGKN